MSKNIRLMDKGLMMENVISLPLFAGGHIQEEFHMIQLIESVGRMSTLKGGMYII